LDKRFLGAAESDWSDNLLGSGSVVGGGEGAQGTFLGVKLTTARTGFMTKLGSSRYFEIPGSILAGAYSGLVFLLAVWNGADLGTTTGLVVGLVAGLVAGLVVGFGAGFVPGLVAGTVEGRLAPLVVTAGAEEGRVVCLVVGGKAVEGQGLLTEGLKLATGFEELGFDMGWSADLDGLAQGFLVLPVALPEAGFTELAKLDVDLAEFIGNFGFTELLMGFEGALLGGLRFEITGGF